ncbi:MAG: NERD domain-containing protein [Muribaculaceae bacterium]|nr:NERD domain-containing protein [Muribaculaceae bacterium]
MTAADIAVIIGAILLLAGWLRIHIWWKYRRLMRRVTGRRRGTPSERSLILALLKRGLRPDDLFHDLYIHTGGGKYAQVDAVAVTDHGLVVFEVKDYSGRIYGRGYNDYWTQVLANGGENHRFYNPVRQNEGHIAALRRAVSGYGFIPMSSVIIFYGDCSLRDMGDLPYDTYVGYPSDLKRILKNVRRRAPKAAYRSPDKLRALLRKGVENGRDRGVRRDHARRVRTLSRPRSWWRRIFRLR